ncbi:MAG: TonB-dependent receptor plug domain-containing protein [Bacteroidales bacterium]|nr:TonB-dependent receptor plug domain-containing protein [Bacteroidales bacterium]
MKRNLLIMLFLSALCAGFAVELTGVVCDAKGKPKKGIEVLLADDVKVKTKKDGIFNIETTKDSITLQVSRDETLTVPVRGDRMVIFLEKKQARVEYDNDTLHIPYVKELKYYSQGILINREQIVKSGARDLYELLKGRVAGCVVNGNLISLRPTGNLRGEMRGGEDLKSNFEPLFFVDGVECRGSAQANVRAPIETIESVEVLKDGTMYGLRGAAGAIHITTIKGATSK